MKNTRSLFTLFVLALSLGACTVFQPPGPHTQSQGVFPGETYHVAKRENAYSLAQRMKVRMSDIIALNNLKPPYLLQPGQTITLPAKDGYAAPTPASAPMDYIDKGYMRPSNSSVAPVESSDFGGAPPSGSRVAGVGGVSSTPLEPISVTPPPSTATPPSQTAPFASVKTTYTETPKPLPPIEPPAGTIENGAEVINNTSGPQDVTPSSAAGASSPHMVQAEADMQAEIQAELERRGTDGTSMPDMGTGSPDPVFGWPVRGTIISTYGPKGKGRDNDGINIGAPKGSPIKAAEAGLVVYAGNEMKGFGNLVLIRHGGNWVTAYAHMDRLTVTKGKSVAKGDMIGTVGATGGVSTPQLHFEVRRSGAPVDPEIVMK
ncbi:MAG: LysM peptidoglycan-binding domain-containing protein [Proteobacteria bacterium]|jgi:murein DD-endopeptidase MepM/ murein hydrolase activator NlpD|nr:LysM peptidoglycan-binding domain-containing M23 family metallopeptidase [Alphaproteobacteria bacterium]NCC03909.1 LysM peptidoglycan-binding domain-containing protein [Pseudomonadota bacterium]